jgi:hypothetical protein
MPNYVYRCVHVPEVLNTGYTGDSHSSAITAYERMINEVTRDGWELVQVDTITSVQTPGCLDGLFGGKNEAVTFKLLILRKAR